jgi:GH25 family lysozyme M1 (1,4-beta-N-acetylmuramidase)
MLRFLKRQSIARAVEASRPIHPSIDVVEPLEKRLLLARAAGIDVSYYQGPSIDWGSVKASGISFAAIRASTGSSGNTYNDPYLATNEANAQAAGIVTGVYHFAYPANNTAIAEATHFVNTAGKYMGPGFLPPELDLETAGGTLSVAALSQWANDFCNYVYTHTGAKPMIYCNTNYAQNYVDTSVSQWYLWIANYNYSSTGNPPVGDSNSGWPSGSWKFFQYTSTGSIPGISGNVDHDVFNGTTTDLAAFLNPGPQISVTNGGTVLDDGSSSVSYGTLTNGAAAVSKTFVVQNVGSETLNLSGLTIPTGYVISDGLVSSLGPGATDNLTLKLLTTTSGKKNGTVSITTNDSDDNPFTWTLTGTIAPKAPTGLAVVQATNNSVALSWTDNSDEVQFEIERKTGAGGTYAQIGTSSANDTTFTDPTTLSPNTTYYYRVRDAVVGPIYSGYSNEVSATTLANTPTNLAASDGTTNTAVHVTWSAAAGAGSYAVFRASTNDSASATQIGTTTNLFYDDSAVAGDIVAYYWVKALNSLSQPSGFSNGDAGLRDTIGPTGSNGAFDFQALPQKITVQFSENVIDSLASDDLSVQDQNDLSKPAFSPSSWSYDSATNTCTFNLPSALADSNYRATIAADDVRDPANNPLQADVTVDFFVLSGDANRNRSVDISDFNILASNFGKSGQTYTQGNFDYSADGTVTITDFNVLASHFGKTMPELTTGQSFTTTAAASAGTIGTPSTGGRKTGSSPKNRVQLLEVAALL